MAEDTMPFGQRSATARRARPCGMRARHAGYPSGGPLHALPAAGCTAAQQLSTARATANEPTIYSICCVTLSPDYVISSASNPEVGLGLRTHDSHTPT